MARQDKERPDYQVTLYPEELEAAGHDRRTAEEAHAYMMDRGAECLRCPLFGLRAGPVRSELRPGAPLMVCGEAPGPDEVDNKRPFIGKTGMMTEDAIWEGGLAREQTSYLNAISCRPPEEYNAYTHRVRIEYAKRAAEAVEKGEAPPPEVLMPEVACRPRLMKDIAEAAPKVALALGVLAVKSVAEAYDVPYGARGRRAKVGEAKISGLKRVLGSPVCPPGKPVIVATYHPAWGVRQGNKHYGHIIHGHIVKAARIAVRDGVLDWKDADITTLNPTLDQVRDAFERFASSGVNVYCDIETDSAVARTATLRCIGYGQQRADGLWEVIVVPFRHIDGGAYRSREEESELRAMCLAFHKRVKLVGHNFVMFDTEKLLVEGLLDDWAQPHDDTMLRHRNTVANDAPHSLGFCISQYTEAPAHKDDANDKYLDGGADDTALHGYCGKDVHRTGVIDISLRAENAACGTEEAYQTDFDTAPIYRNMYDLGMVIDMAKHKEMWLKFAGKRQELIKSTRDVVGDDKFNPNAPDQIRDFLYRKKGLIPVISTNKGKEWKPGDDPSTNANALQQLILKRALDEQTKQFIESISKYRAVDKVVGSYIKGLVKDRTAKSDMDEDDVAEVKGAPDPETDLERYIDWAYARIGSKSNTSILRESYAGIGELYMLHCQYKMHIPTGRVATSPTCFDDQTDILTRRGWVRFSALTRDDEVAQFVAATKQIEFVRPTGYVEKDHDGEMVTLRSEVIDACVSPDHRMLLFYRKGDRHQTVRADELVYDRKIPVAGAYTEGKTRWPAWKVTLVVAAQADGWHKSYGQWDFSFTKTRKVERLEAALTAAQAEWLNRPKQNGSYEQRRIVVTAGMDEVSELLGPDKLFGAWLLDLDAETLQLFREELYYWDGCITRMNHYSTSVRNNADWAQIVHTLTGQRAKVRRYENAGTTMPNWQIDRVEQGYVMTTPQSTGRRMYTGKVYCVSVPSSYVVVRRNERPFVAGNCQNWPQIGVANMRELGIVPPGYVFVGADFEQIELRLYAVIAGDEVVLEAFAKGLDVHTLNYATLRARNPRDMDEVMKIYHEVIALKSAGEAGDKKAKRDVKSWRTLAKRFVYLICYGGETERLFATMSTDRDKATGQLLFEGLTPQQVSIMYNNWHTTHPWTIRWQEEEIKHAKDFGWVQAILDGRKRHFPGGLNKRNAAPNAKIQGSAAAICNRAVKALGELLTHRGWGIMSGMNLQIHDYIGAYVPVARAEEAARTIQESMEFNYKGMPFPAVPGISESWATQ